MPGRPFIAIFPRIPFSYIIVPAAAIIAALSVHKLSGGIKNGVPFSANAFSRDARRPLFAATPPAAITCFTLYAPQHAMFWLLRLPLHCFGNRQQHRLALLDLRAVLHYAYNSGQMISTR